MKTLFIARLRTAIIIMLGVFIALSLFAAANQSALIFFPTHNANRNPTWTTPNGGDIGIELATATPEHVFLMFHGNAGQADDRTPLRDFLPAHSALYIMEYPGYGPRAGELTEAALNAAALQAYDILAARYPDIYITLIGQSLGCGPAAYVASVRDTNRIILITPYGNFPSLAQEKLSLLPTYMLCAYRWNVAELLANFSGSITLIGAQDDKVIPLHHARNLAYKLPRAKLYTIPGGHNSFDPAEIKKILNEKIF